MARTYIFRGDSETLTREHIWPQWINDARPGEGGFVFTRQGPGGKFERPWEA